VKRILQIALGVVTAFGGFVDIGELVFNVQAGAQFGYQLLWVVPIGVVGIAAYAEMCGRVAAVTKRPVFDVVRQRMGFTAGLVTLISSELINVLTLTAEVGGIALILQLLFPDLPFRILLLLSTVGLVAIIQLLPFGGIERVFGYGGCLLIVFVVAAIHLKPDWGDVAGGFVPHWQTGQDTLVYWYFAVGVLAAALIPYEVFFYSSGAIEDGWEPKDLILNKANTVVGWGLGGILSVALIVVSAQLLQPLSVKPEFIGTTALTAQVPLSSAGFLIAVLGMLFAVGGAAAEVSFSGAYTLAQFCGWEWGKYRGAREAPRFTATWILMFLVAFVVVLTGADPVLVTEYAVVLAVVALPLTYLPILLIARDERYMGTYANGRLANFLGWLYLGVIGVVALAAVPLLLATNAGSG
jgi:manganese transport protein